MTDFFATMAPNGTPPPSAFPVTSMSGTVPVELHSHTSPDLPSPDWTSSATKSIFRLSHSCLSLGRNSFGGTMYPPSPWSGSTKTEARLPLGPPNSSMAFSR